MKNIWNYYLVILLPLVLLILLMKFQKVDGLYFAILFVFYALVYRTYTDTKRLILKNKMNKKDWWKMLIPGTRIEHFRELYLK